MRCYLALLIVLSWLVIGQNLLAQSTNSNLPTDLRTRRFGQDWPKFLGNNIDSKSSETGIITNWANNGLRIVWKHPLKQSYGTCTTSLGRLFQFDSDPVSRRESLGKLICLNSETGQHLWTYTYKYEYADQYGYNNGPRASPIVDGNRVYILGVDGKLICVRVADGQELWSVDTNQKYGVVQNFFGVGSNPVVYGNLLLVMVGGSPAGTRRIDQAQGNGSGIVAFDKMTGKEVYKLSDELASYASLQLVRSSQRTECLAFMRGGLLGFDAATGRQRYFFPWRARILESVNASVPVVFDNQVFISETYGPGSALLDISQMASGRPRAVWQDQQRSREKAMQTHWNTAIHHKGYLYGSSGRHEYNAELRCVEASTGKLMWAQPGLARCSLLYVDGHFVCLSEVGIVFLLKANPQRYQEVSQIVLREGDQPLLNSPAWAAPVLSHGLLYLRGRDYLVCTELIPDSKN